MVTQYGMTERLGAIRYGQEQGEVFLGRDFGHTRDYSEDVAAVDRRGGPRLIEAAHHEACQAIVDNRDVLDALVVELLEKETLDKAEVARIFEPLRKLPERAVWTGRRSSGRVRPAAGADAQRDRRAQRRLQRLGRGRG